MRWHREKPNANEIYQPHWVHHNPVSLSRFDPALQTPPPLHLFLEGLSNRVKATYTYSFIRQIKLYYELKWVRHCITQLTLCWYHEVLDQIEHNIREWSDDFNGREKKKRENFIARGIGGFNIERGTTPLPGPQKKTENIKMQR